MKYFLASSLLIYCHFSRQKTYSIYQLPTINGQLSTPGNPYKALLSNTRRRHWLWILVTL
jgi:hypothetical protein